MATAVTLTRGLDAATILTPYAQRIADAGFSLVGRYLKSLSIAEIAAIHGAGLGLWLIEESTAARALAGAGAGKDDGAKAIARAQALGAPKGAAIFPTVDTDVLPSQLPVVAGYIVAFAAICGAAGYSCGGPYACGDVHTYLAENATTAVWAPWLAGAMGWSGSRSYDTTNAWALKQGPQINAGRTASWANFEWPALPFPYDPDLIARPDFGAWLPPSATAGKDPSATQVPPSLSMTIVLDSPDSRKMAQAALAAANLYDGKIDGLWGPRSAAALAAFNAR